MPFTLLPNADCLVPVEWNIKFLTKCATILDQFEWESRVMPPLTRLIELLKEDLVDGCSVTSIEADHELKSCKGPRDIVEFLKAEWYMNPRKAELDLLAYDYAVSTSYLILPLKAWPGYTNHHHLVLWRHSRIFSPDDVITIKLALSMFKAREIQYTASIQAELDVKQNDSNPADWSKFIAIKKALNMVSEIIIICDHEGSILSMNRAAEESLSKDGTVLTRGNSWIAHACHPDDAKEVLNNWKEAYHDGMQKSLRCRLMVEAHKYRSFLCHFTPSDSIIKGKLNWIITALNTEEVTSPKESLSVTKLKGRFLTEISHGNIDLHARLSQTYFILL